MSEFYKPREPAPAKLPKCEQHLAYCVSNRGGRCRSLTDTHFAEGRICPFFCDKRLVEGGTPA